LLVSPKNKYAVLDDGPANRTAGLVEIEPRLAVRRIRLALRAGLVDVVHRVVILVLVELERRSVPVVGATFGYDVQLAASRMAILRAELVRDERELSNGISHYVGLRTRDVHPIVVQPVYREIVHSRASAAD